MEINKNTWHAKFYYWSYKDRPDSLCPYFWKLLLAIVFLPLTWLGYIIPYFRKNLYMTISTYIMITASAYLFVFMGYILGYEYFRGLSLVVATAIGTLVFVLGTSLLLLFGWFVLIYLPEKLSKQRINSWYEKKEPKTNLIKERYKAFKGRYCPKIDWK